MYTVIRTYTGTNAKKLADLLVEHKGEVEDLLRGVAGLVNYTAARTAEGAVTITVCRDKAGADESVKVARDWVAKRGATLGLGSPFISEGEVVMHLK
jgi:hypothetical protein